MKAEKKEKTDYSDSIEDKKHEKLKKKKAKPIIIAVIVGVFICTVAICVLVFRTNLKEEYKKVEDYANNMQVKEYDSLPLREFDSEYLSLDNAKYSKREEKKEAAKEEVKSESAVNDSSKITSVSAKSVGLTQNGKLSITKKFKSPVKKGTMVPVVNEKKEIEAVEITCKEGSKVLAVADGSVSEVITSKDGFCITVTHDDGYVSILSGNGKANVREGRNVKEGSVIATTDKSMSSVITLSLKKDQTLLNPIIFF